MRKIKKFKNLLKKMQRNKRKKRKIRNKVKHLSRHTMINILKIKTNNRISPKQIQKESIIFLKMPAICQMLMMTINKEMLSQPVEVMVHRIKTISRITLDNRIMVNPQSCSLKVNQIRDIIFQKMLEIYPMLITIINKEMLSQQVEVMVHRIRTISKTTQGNKITEDILTCSAKIKVKQKLEMMKTVDLMLIAKENKNQNQKHPR